MAAETTGHLRKRLRDERGWTQQQVADEYCRVSGAIAKDAREVGRWGRGTRIPTPETRTHLAIVFGVPAGVLDRAAGAARQARQEEPAGGSTPAPGEVIDVDRRTFIGAVAAAPISTAMAEPRHVDPALIPYFQQQLEGTTEPTCCLGRAHSWGRSLRSAMSSANSWTRRTAPRDSGWPGSECRMRRSPLSFTSMQVTRQGCCVA